MASFSRQKSKSADDIQIIANIVDTKNVKVGRDAIGTPTKLKGWTLPKSASKTLKESEKTLLKTTQGNALRQQTYDGGVKVVPRPSAVGALISQIHQPAMKKSDLKTNSSGQGSSPRAGLGQASPLMGKKLMPSQENGQQSAMSGSSARSSDEASTAGASSDELLPDLGSDTGTDEVDNGEGSSKTKLVVERLRAKIQRTKEAIIREQNVKEAIVNEYLQVTTEKQPTARIKALFEKKNQKSAQNIVQLQRKLDNYQQRLAEVEAHGWPGHKQTMERLRDVGQGINTIVSKPKELAHIIKNKFGSADNIHNLSKFYIELEDPTAQIPGPNGKTGVTFLTSYKYGSDDEASSLTSGSGPRLATSSQHYVVPSNSAEVVNIHQTISAITREISEIKESSRTVSDVLLRLAEEFEDFKFQMVDEVASLRSHLEEEKFRVERMEEQMNDLTELHQHEMLNLKQDLSSMEEKIEYRLDERTTDLSDLMDNVSTRISRLEQQQQQQQILSMEMVENATFRNIISKLINVVLALLAVVLVFVSTGAKLLSPFVNSTSRLVLSLVTILVSWLIYQNQSHIRSAIYSAWNLLPWPYS